MSVFVKTDSIEYNNCPFIDLTFIDKNIILISLIIEFITQELEKKDRNNIEEL